MIGMKDIGKMVINKDREHFIGIVDNGMVIDMKVVINKVIEKERVHITIIMVIDTKETG